MVRDGLRPPHHEATDIFKQALTKRAALPRPFAYSKKFLKDFERFNKARNLDIGRLKTLMLLLIANDGPLDKGWKDHPLDKAHSELF